MVKNSSEPLPTSVSSESNDHRLRRVDERTLVLEPRYDIRSILGGGLIFGFLGLIAREGGRLAGIPDQVALWGGVICGAGGVGYVVGLLLFSPLWTRVLFDRELGTITLTGWRFQNRPTFRFEEVAAVQLCGPFQQPEWQSYQLNLALAPGSTKAGRLNLLDNGDRSALTRFGAELACFLRVPFTDQVSMAQPGNGSALKIDDRNGERARFC